MRTAMRLDASALLGESLAIPLSTSRTLMIELMRQHRDASEWTKFRALFAAEDAYVRQP